MHDKQGDSRYPPRMCSSNSRQYGYGCDGQSLNCDEYVKREGNADNVVTAKDNYELKGDYDEKGNGDCETHNGYYLYDHLGGPSSSLRCRKKRKVAEIRDCYEFSARAPILHEDSTIDPPIEWTQSGTFALLDAWGERFVRRGRKSLRSDDWHEIAEKLFKDDVQCRSRLDSLKQKYRKEKLKSEKLGISRWVYFERMNMLLSSPPGQKQTGLACGVDGGEYVFMNPEVYLNCSNGFDEMRDSPSGSACERGDKAGDEDGDELPSGEDNDDGGGGVESVMLLADSLQSFGKIYESIEASKRQQMMELEKMRMEFYREMELQKQEMLERAELEISRMNQEDSEEDTCF